ncbi:MAG: hypothetical protein ABFD46_00215 [Armatimonadota bacterium]
MSDKCVLCGRECKRNNDFMRDILYYSCISCGDYAVTADVESDYLSRMDQVLKYRIAACAQERNIRGLPKLRLYSSEPTDNVPDGAYTLNYVLDTIFPSRIQDRFDRVLGNLTRKTAAPGDTISLSLETDLPTLFAESTTSARFILAELHDLGYINLRPIYDMTADIIVKATGIERIQRLEESEGREQSKQAFVAMWFNKELNDVFNKGIKTAAADCGFKVHRIDTKETNQKICDEIIAEIRRSRFLIADFTGSRGGVYFEAGFALGLGIPVIWTCRNKKEDIDSLHFDTRQYCHILWNDAEDMRFQLRNRIAATIPGAKLVNQQQ